jgi:hypothetical protein
MGQRGIKKKGSGLRKLAVCSFGILLIWALFKIFSGGTPGDGSLVKKFNQHRAAFLELKALMATNQTTQDPTVTAKVWSMPDYQRYVKLTKEIGVNQAQVEKEEYHFQVVGPETAGKAKCRVAIVWRESAPDHLIASLDEFRKTGTQPEYAYRSLGEGWYLWITK